MNLFKLFIPLILLNSCAQILAPEGGSKDVSAPICIKSAPLSNSVNCTPKKIELYFDENIGVKNPSTGITISPKINASIDVKYSKNKIELMVPKDSLKPNTTYCINFGDHIMDINEGNILRNFNFSFSTGSFLDTSISMGSVVTIKENTPIINAIVELTNTKTRLRYTNITDKTGFWTLNNLAKGNYDVLIYQDANLNLLLDQGEYYWYKNIQIGPSPLTIKSKLIPFESQRSVNTSYILKYKPINDYSFSMVLNTHEFNEDTVFKVLKCINDATILMPKNTSRNDSFIIYHSYTPNDSLKLRFQTNDTTQHLTIPTPNTSKKQDLTFSVLNPTIAKNDPLYVKSSIPVKSIKFSSSKSRAMVHSISPYVFTLMNVNLNKGFFVLEPTEILDINGEANKGDTLFFKAASQEQTGNFSFTLLDSSINYAGPIKLKISNATLAYSYITTLNKINKIEALLPGKYTMEAYQDENNNGLWDAGNYYLNLNPEKIILLKDFIQIKENWDNSDVNIYMD